jgi:hypothetical protein
MNLPVRASPTTARGGEYRCFADKVAEHFIIIQAPSALQQSAVRPLRQLSGAKLRSALSGRVTRPSGCSLLSVTSLSNSIGN